MLRHLDVLRLVSDTAAPRGYSISKIRLVLSCRYFIFELKRFIMSDQDIQQLESLFPATSRLAFAAAQAKVLASGQSVLQSQDGVIYEISPNGQRKEIKRIEPPTSVVIGSCFTIR